jgi:CheY-like chemotaxis protein
VTFAFPIDRAYVECSSARYSKPSKVPRTFANATDSAIGIIPSLLWIAFAATVVAVFYKPIRDEVIPRLGTLKLPGGFELALRDRVEAAAQAQGVSVSEDDKSRIVKRLERSADLLKTAKILWVDDHPENNLNEAGVLRSFGASIEVATTTQQGFDLLSRRKFDVVISDIAREGRDDEGVRFVEKTEGRPWTILYAGDVHPELGTQPYAFGITNRPHQLLHYVLDALERERG